MQKFPTVLWVVAGALLREDGAVLLHRRPAHKHHGGLWEFPGGKLEPGESPREGLVRELREELAIDCDPHLLERAGFADVDGESLAGHTVILLYTVRSWTGDLQAMEPGAQIAWFMPEDIDRMDMPPLDIALAHQLFGASG